MEFNFKKVICFKWINEYTKCEYFVAFISSDLKRFLRVSDLEYVDSLEYHITQLKDECYEPIFTDSKVIINLFMNNNGTYEEMIIRKKLAFNLIQ